MTRVLLVGNAPMDGQQSMLRFGTLMADALSGHAAVTTTAPEARLSAKLAHTASGWRKWIGYVDKHLFYPPRLMALARAADVVHVLDHSNAAYVPSRRAQPWVVTCHDLLAVRSALGLIPGRRIGSSGRQQQAMIRRGLARADLIVSVSPTTDADVAELIGVPLERRVVVPNALNRAWARPAPAVIEATLRRLGRDPARPYVLHVGGNQWYKNRPGVVAAFTALSAMPGGRDLDLVLAGKPPDDTLAAAIAASPAAARITVLNDVDDAGLEALYGGAELLLFPSLAEGFGWPVVEAQACGCPVVTADRAPLPWVAGAAAELAPPDDPVALAEACLRARARRTELVTAGQANVVRFTAPAMADGYLAAYRMAQASR